MAGRGEDLRAGDPGAPGQRWGERRAPATGPDAEHFQADLTSVVYTHLNETATMLVVEWWTPTQGLRRIERA